MGTIPLSLDEQLKSIFVPNRLYMLYKYTKERLKGEREMGFLPYLVDPDRVCVDVGANKGVYTYALSRLCPWVHAFEPNPAMYQLLQQRAPKNATTYPIALSNRTEDAYLRVPKGGHRGFSNQGASLSVVKVSSDYVEVPVSAKRLDDMSIENIGFMKIDVEGFEREVLEGAVQTLQRDRPTLLIEMEECHTKRPIRDDIAFVEGLGYRAFALFKGNTLRSIDHFDPAVHHHDAKKNDRDNYLFNFIFLPVKADGKVPCLDNETDATPHGF